MRALSLLHSPHENALTEKTMTLLRTPLLSFGAHGKLGNSVALAEPHNRTQARKLPIPSDPQTPAQLALRAQMAMAVDVWRTYPGLWSFDFSGWDPYARITRQRGSGYSCAIKTLIHSQRTAFRFGIFAYVVWPMAPDLWFMVSGIVPGDPRPPDSGDYTIYLGLNPRELTYFDSLPVVANRLILVNPPHQTETTYGRIDKDGWTRGGIFEIPPRS